MKNFIRFFKKWDKRTYIIAGACVLTILLIVAFIVLKPFSSGKKHKASDFIPESAFTVFRFNNAGEILHKNENKVIIEKIIFIPAVKTFMSGLLQADSVFSLCPETKNILYDSKLFVSLHSATKDKIESLIVLELPDSINSKTVYEKLNNSGKISFNETETNGKTCYTINKSTLIFYPVNNILVASSSNLLLEQAINAKQKNTGISNNKDFVNAFNKATNECAINVFVNTPLLYKSLGRLFSPDTYLNLAFIQTLSSWGNIDVTFQDNAINFSGLFPITDNKESFMSLFDQPLDEASQSAFSMLPINTSAAFSFGFESFNGFFAGYTERLSNDKHNSYNNKAEISHLNKEIKAESFESCIYNRIDGLLCVFSTGTGINKEPDVTGVFKINNRAEIRKCLLNYANKNKWDTTSFRNAVFINVPVEYMAYSLFGPLFESIDETCIAIVEDFVYIGKSIENLKPIVNDILSGRTLSTVVNKNKLNDKVTSSWNVFSYLNANTAMYYLVHKWLGDSALVNSIISSHKKQQQIGTLSFSAAKHQSGIIISCTWLFENSETNLTDSWTTLLDANITGQPVILKDSKGENYWIAVADVYDNLYLLNSEGEIIWKKEVGDGVNSDFQILWPDNAEKRSLAFTTSEGVYVINFNGKIHSSFPISIKSGISSNLLVTDYDNNGKYRLIFCDNKGILNNYTADGKTTDGWLKPSLSQKGQCNVFYNPLNGNDYIVVSFKSGEVCVFDRKGKFVFSTDKIQNNKGFNPLFGDKSSKAWLAFSPDGELIEIKPDGETAIISEKSYGENVLFNLQEGSIYVVSEGNLIILNKEGKELFYEKISASSIDNFKVITANNEIFIIYHNNDDNLGILSQKTEYKELLYKTQALGFASTLYKAKILLTGVVGKTVETETIIIE